MEPVWELFCLLLWLMAGEGDFFVLFHPTVNTEFDRRILFIFSLFNHDKKTLSATFTAG